MVPVEEIQETVDARTTLKAEKNVPLVAVTTPAATAIHGKHRRGADAEVSDTKSAVPSKAEDDDAESEMDAANFLSSSDDEDQERGDSDVGESHGDKPIRSSREVKEAKLTLGEQPPEADLYASSSTRQQLSERKPPPKIFVPSASDAILMHAILTHDEELLGDLLGEMSPDDVLTVRDAVGRSMYHYAVLSRRQRVRSLAFSHASEYYSRELEWRVEDVMDKTQHLRA